MLYQLVIPETDRGDGSPIDSLVKREEGLDAFHRTDTAVMQD